MLGASFFWPYASGTTERRAFFMPQRGRTMVSAADFLTLREVMEVTKMGKSTIYRLVGNGHFPAPVKWGERAVRWDARELEAWTKSRPRAEVGAN